MTNATTVVKLVSGVNLWMGYGINLANITGLYLQSQVVQNLYAQGAILHVKSAPDTVYVREPVGLMDHQKAKSLGDVN